MLDASGATLHYHDAHLHLATPDGAGFDALLAQLDRERGQGLVGGNLILNTPQEIAVVERRLREVPRWLCLVPPLFDRTQFHPELTRSGWYKLHPVVHRIDRARIPEIVAEVGAAGSAVRGLIVHCYPWGAELDYCHCLELVLALARTFPNLPLLVSHGGGYRSWDYRAHTGGLANVHYDFSVTMAYYRGADLLRPFGIYAKSKPGRVLFGSDWPSADPQDQLESCCRVAGEYGVSAADLAGRMLANARRLWPGYAD